MSNLVVSPCVVPGLADQVQLRNSRAALVADRRVWLLERRQRELAALANAHPQSSGDQTSQPRVSQAQPLLEGLRPECEAVMRALFCRVDRYLIAVSHVSTKFVMVRERWNVSGLKRIFLRDSAEKR